ncbi:MAG: DUF2997 domain-containing protein [Synechococcales cyanobacterium RM1_1_8]|nr:DUF2997 domain-containing protein [Synechococcales cyanobacterium RM1_1_8]
METLEFIIYPDGRVEETVTGIVGRSCAEVTAAIEAKLGRVIDQKPSSEFYSQPNQDVLTQSATGQTTGAVSTQLTQW